MPGFEIKGWCPAPSRPMRSGDGWIMRLKPLGGRISAAQARGIAAISRRYGNGRMELTNRGSLQLRGIRDDALTAAQDDLAALDLDQAGALAAVLLAPGGDDDALARELAQVLAAHPGLPAKFGLAIDTGPQRLLSDAMADLHVQAHGNGLALRLSGRARGIAVTRDNIAGRLDDLLAHFIAQGTQGGRGRMRDWDAPLDETAPPPPLTTPTPGPFGGLVLHGLAFGAITADLLETCAETGPLVLTSWRMIGLTAALDHPDLILDPADPMLRAHACVGAPDCEQGHGPVRDLARALAPRLGMGESLHVSGCAKHCACPLPATHNLTRTPSGLIYEHPDGPPIPIRSKDQMTHQYETDGAAIYARSFSIIRAEADLARFTPEEERVAVRMIHAAGLVGLERDIRMTPDFATAAIAALQAGAPVLCDARMVSEGITRKRLPAANQVICTLNDAQVPMLAQAMANTRSAAALELWRPNLAGAVVAIGNAPTALFHLLNMLEDPDCPRPAAIIGCPVGFVGAAESKDALIAAPPVPSLVVLGRLGGSAVTVAAVNALASAQE